MGIRSFGFALLAAAGLASAGSAQVVYSNNFDSGTASGFVVTGAQGGANANGVVSFDSGAHTFIGILTQNATATLSLTGLTAGSTLTVGFDVYGFHSLDNDNPSSPGGDFFNVFAGATQIVHDEYGFVTCVGGCYTTTPVASELPTAGTFVSEDQNGFGTGTYYVGERTYHYSLTFTNPNAALSLAFVGAANQAWSDEGFGLDNVQVSQAVSTTVPEPATWAMMVAGFGAIGVAARRRGRTLAAAI